MCYYKLIWDAAKNLYSDTIQHKQNSTHKKSLHFKLTQNTVSLFGAH